jgi:uncharacterized delta-60 repeat protein
MRHSLRLRFRPTLRCLEGRIAPAGALDPTFGNGGLVTTAFNGSQFADGQAVAVDRLGRTLVAGFNSMNFMVARYRYNGALDPTFGGTGIVTINFRPDGSTADWSNEAHAIAVDASGRIVVAGDSGPATAPQQFDFAVARLTDSGALDTSFNGNGKQTVDFGGQEFAESLAIDSQGRIVLAGYNAPPTGPSHFLVARLTAAGALDNSFGGGGRQVIDFGGATQIGFAVDVDSLDRVVVAGTAQIGIPTYLAVARLTSVGLLDPSFDGDGRQTITFSDDEDAYGVAVDSQDRVVVAGRTNNGTNNDFAVARLTVAGALDVSFDSDGKQTVAFGSRDDFAWSVAVDSLGKIVVVGYTSLTQSKNVFAVARLTDTGAFDTSFDADGKQTIDFGSVTDNGFSVAIASGNRVVIAGYSNVQIQAGRFSIARLTGDTTVATTEVNDGSVQRSRVTSLTVYFSGQVSFSGPVAQAFTLMRTGGGAVTFTAEANVVNGGTVVTISNFTGPEAEFGSLRDGRFTLTALASQISAGGQALDGNGDGTPGDNYIFGDAQGLYRFYGDINGDRHVDIADFGVFSQSIFNAANYVAALDFNNDGHVDIQDFGQFSLRIFTMLP